MSHWRQVTQAVAATIVTAALVAGVPYALVRGVTWPPLRPTLVALRYGQATPDLLIAVLAIIVWVAWAQLTLSLVVEIAAAARGVVANRVALLGVMQPVAARLISAVLLLSSTFGARPAAAMPSPAAVVAAAVDNDPVDDNSSGTADRSEATTVADLKRYEVRRGDTLWGIAERHLGDGRRWREIRDLNAGRPQPGGRTLAAKGDAIDVGWTLLLPRSNDPESNEDAARVVVEPGDTLSQIAAEHLHDADQWPVLFERNQGRRQPDGDRLTDPDTLQPGWRIDIPRTQAHGDRARPDTSDRLSRPARRDRDMPGGGGALPRMSADAREELHAAVSKPTVVTPTAASTPIDDGNAEGGGDLDAETNGWWWVAAAGMTAAGAIAALGRQLRVWQRRRGFGDAPPDTSTGDAAVSADALRPTGTERARARACLAVRAFAAAVPDAAIAGVTVDVDGTIALLLEAAAPDELPNGWYPDAFDTRAVELPPNVPNHDLQPAAALTAAAASTLVSVGIGTRTGQLLLIALETAHSVALDGPVDLVEDTMLTWTLELVTSDHAAALDIWLVGFDLTAAADVAGWERIHFAATVTDAITAVRGHALGADPHRLPDRGDDDWVPQVIVCHPQLTAAPLRSIQAFAAAHRDAGVVAVTAGDHATAGWRLTVATDTVTVTSLQQPITLRPVRRITRGEFSAITGTMAAAKHTAAETLQRPADPGSSNAAALLERLTAPAGPPYDADVLPDDLVVVRLLGPVTIQTPTGTPAPPGRITEAIAYLACHRGGAGVVADRLIDVLWNGRAVDRQRLTEVISRARQAIGGVDRLPRRSNGHGYQVADSVVTDIELVGWWIRHAQRDPDGIREHLGAALNLVTGRPFADVDWTWALLDGHAAAAVALICDVAIVLGQWCLDHDDPAGALHAAGQGRKAAPDSEQLARLRMRAYYQRGDLDRVRAVMSELRAAVDADLGPDGDDQLHPDTIALYRTLTGQAVAAGR